MRARFSPSLKGNTALETYKIIIERPAQVDLEEILDYIALVLREKRSAERIYKAIKDEIISLAELPFRCPLLRKEPYRSIGVRRLLVESYAAFYTVDEENKAVHILRILYNRREWQALL